MFGCPACYGHGKTLAPLESEDRLGAIQQNSISVYHIFRSPAVPFVAL